MISLPSLRNNQNHSNYDRFAAISQSMENYRVVDRNIKNIPNVEYDLNFKTNQFGDFKISSFKRPFQAQFDTPTNIRAIKAEKNIDYVFPLHPGTEQYGQRFFNTCNELDISVANEKLYIPDGFKKDGEEHKKLTPEKIDKITTALLEASILNQHPAVFCGAGDGRSGVIKTAFFMKSETSEELLSYKYEPEGIVVTLLNNDFAEEVNYTPANALVADIIGFIRIKHPKAVERTEDVVVLNDYYDFLVQKYEAELADPLLPISDAVEYVSDNKSLSNDDVIKWLMFGS